MYRSCILILFNPSRPSRLFPITVPFPHLPQSPTMATNLNNIYDDFWSFDNVNADAADSALPSVTPPSLESFEDMIDALLEPENLDVDVTLNVQFPTMTPPLPDISSLTRRVASTQSQSTYSMPGLTNTEYSSMIASTSNYLPLPPFNPARRDIILGFEYNNVNPKPNPVISESTTTMFPPGVLVQHYHVVNAQPDNEPDRQIVGISPHCLSAAIANPPPAIPIDPPTSTPSTSHVFTGPIRTKHTKKPKKEPTCNRCDQCGRGKYNCCVIYFRDIQCFFLVFDRKSNLTSHMKTHDPNRERPFVCPEIDCTYSRFTRSHDLERHRTNPNIHGVRAE